jgi:hypothetical protein
VIRCWANAAPRRDKCGNYFPSRKIFRDRTLVSAIMLEKEPSSLPSDGREPTEPIPQLHPGSRSGQRLYAAFAILAFTLAAVALLAMVWKFGH